MGGKKPISLTTSIYHNVQNSFLSKSDPNFFSLKITGVTVGLGMRLRKPDDYFTLYQAIDFQRYALKNYSFNESGITFPDDDIYNIAYKITWGRNSTDYPIYPRKGSLFNITGEATLPYSWFRGETNYSEMPGYERYRFLEYYKIKVNSSWFTEILPKLVIKSAGEFGYLGAFRHLSVFI